MKKHAKNGFTLSELMAVLAILAIIAAIAIPTAIHYINLAEFRKNESNAKTVYLAAESELTWYRTSGQWEQFRKSVIRKGTLNDAFDETEYEHLKGRKIYAVTLDNKKGTAAGTSDSGKLVEDILEDNIYDKDFFNAAITIEIDIDTGQVYSAFYATRCDSLAYDGTDEKDGNGSKILDISAKEKDGVQNRSYESRRKRFLGYYSVEDVTNVVDMKPVRLKVGSINLVNSETLSLNWSSTSRHDNLDVEFTVTFYKDKEGLTGEGQRLFSLTVNRAELQSGQGWSGSSGQMALLEFKDESDGNDGAGSDAEDGTPAKPTQKWAFPLSYQKTGNGQNARFSLVLDGMMSPELTASLEANQSKKDYQKEYSTSIARLQEAVPELKDPQDIYAVVEVKPTYKNMSGDTREYRASSPVKSNVENTLFAKGTKTENGKLEAKVTRFRHLSNIRYYAADKDAVFTLTGRNMDWTSNSTGLYDLTEKKQNTGLAGTDPGSADGGGTGSGGTDTGKQLMTVQWKNVKTTDPDTREETVLDFPSIPLLSKNHILKGNKDNTLVSNLHLGNGSMADDKDIEKIYKENADKKAYAQYLGLFCESKGTIQDITLRSPILTLTGQGENPAADYANLRGAGILCGRSEGTLTDVSVDSTGKETVVVRLDDRTDVKSRKEPAGIGGLVGVLAEKNEDGSLAPQKSGSIQNLTMGGSVYGRLPKPEKAFGNGADQDLQAPQKQAAEYPYGIGGIFGYAELGGNVKVENCQNRASVTGNLFTGGIGGNMKGSYSGAAQGADIEGCYNDGLVLCDEKAGHQDQELELEGRYFGGILGFGMQTKILTSSSASGRAVGYEYTANDRRTLVGQYVGGILGYGDSCRLSGCSTQKDGYILGSDYVGGIAGGLANNIQDVITGAENVSVTVNAGYVIGNRYVGGIVGKNDGNVGGSGEQIYSTIKDCVNNGIAAGYDCYIGGIAGYNGKYGKLQNCASYYSDYGQSMLNTIKEKWQAATGDCVGGLAGYNNGTVIFEADASATVKSVSSVVVGKNFVGGMVGFNDADSKFRGDTSEGKENYKLNYALVGGQIHGTGDGVGGCIGLNASTDILKQNLEIRPSSVNGRYCVGGFIGANVIDPAGTDVKMTGIRINNVLGNVTGTAFTGGIIGYQRTYAAEQIGQETAVGQGETNLLRRMLRTVSAGDTGDALLPGLGEGNIPTAVEPSQARGNLFCIENIENSAGSLDSADTNIPVVADMYAGGVVGYCERNSKLVLRNCKNAGNITKKTVTADESDVSQKVSLKAYLTHLAEGKDDSGFGNAASEIDGEEIYVSMIGGIISSNLENQVIDHCGNTGSMNGFVGLGGIVGLNAGGIFDCELKDNFGNTRLNYIGGIAGLNVKGDEILRTYKGGNYDPGEYTSGTIAACTTAAGRTVFGRSYVGGIAGFNLSGGVLTKNRNRADVSAAGNYAGGIAGANSGTIQTAEDTSQNARTVSGIQGEGIGGITGWNQRDGRIEVAAASVENGGIGGNSGTGGSQDEVIAVSSAVSIDGKQKVGGIAGINEGTLLASGSAYLTSQAGSVRAREGYAGGIAGESGKAAGQAEDGAEGAGGDTSAGAADGSGSGFAGAGFGSIEKARNKCVQVTADKGPAGGIVAVNQRGVTLKQCGNLGNVNSDQGYAGGIAAENYGEIQDCTVGYDTESNSTDQIKNILIHSRGTDEIGAVCAVNKKEAVISGSIPLYHVELSGSAEVIGGIAGANQGTIKETVQEIKSASDKKDEKSALDITVSSNALTVGGAAGRNEDGAVIQDVNIIGLKFIDFKNFQYLGGITGLNEGGGTVENCTFSGGKIRDAGSAAGSCYGGVAGLNRGMLSQCSAEDIHMDIQGIYTATSTSTAIEKENGASHAGGIVGKNEEDSTVTGCRIKVSGKGKTNFITAGSGMAGGIVGYNKGMVEKSGDSDTAEAIEGDQTIQAMTGHGYSADGSHVAWGNVKSELENLSYAGGSREKVNAGRDLSLIMSTNGNVGGITAYNAPTGSVSYCATGNWYLNNKSNAIGVGTGGIIGMNESEKNLSFLLNRAFVGRQLSSGVTDRFAGGIIGNQNNTTLEGWKIENCANYGTVYCLNTHYSGGIIGQWTGTGGSIEKCYNLGNLQTTYQEGWKGASSGIVAQLYHAYEGNEYNIISCKNYGNIYGQSGRSTAGCANDSAGILGNITAYQASEKGAQKYSIQVLDCVNEAGVEIYSSSMASGIVGFFSSDSPNNSNITEATANIDLRIERCRNYAYKLQGIQFVGGIFGDRYGNAGSQKTFLQDCYSVNPNGTNYNYTNYPIISYASGQSRPGDIQAARNYFFEAGSYDNWRNGITISDNLKRAATNRAYYYTKNNKRYALYIDPEKSKSVNYNQIYIDQDIVYASSSLKEQVGNVLFEIGSGNYANLGSVTGNIGFDEYVRRAYYKVEGSSPGGQMHKPDSVSLSRTADTAKITVNPWTDTSVTPHKATKPFKYIAALYVDNGGNTAPIIEEFEFYSNEYNIDLSRYPAAQAGSLIVEVRACSMYDDVQDSESVKSTDVVAGQKMLPNPDIRIELEMGAGGKYQYRFSIGEESKKKYDDLKLGAEDYGVFVTFMDGKNTTLELKPGQSVPHETVGAELQQLLVQAKPTGTNTVYAPSAQVSVPVYLPKYRPSIQIGNEANKPKATPSVSFTGTSLSDLGITVTLDASGTGNITTPPIYRADLIGTWTGEGDNKNQEVVLDSKDILTASNGITSATFSDLAEGMENTKDLKVRVWYAQSGLGPVYTWHPSDNESGANRCTLKGMETQSVNGVDTEVPVWEYSYSAVLADTNTWSGFGNYQWTSRELFTWLGPPILEGAGTKLEPSSMNPLKYKFSWNHEPGQETGHSHIVTLKGVAKDADGNENLVSIKTAEEVTGNEYEVDAEKWDYAEVELTVACKGNSVNQIGLFATGRYQVKQRLQKPEQPIVTNQNVDELNYTFEWPAIHPETGCVSYAIYMQKYKADGTLEPAQLIKTVGVGEKQDGRYVTERDLEEYAQGQETKMRIYLVAKAAPDDIQYTDSLEGAAYELTVPARIAPPRAAWTKTWDYDRNHPVSKDGFQALDPLLGGSLKVTVTPDAGSSQTTGDSSYLLKAYVFDRPADYTGNDYEADVKKMIEEGNDAGLEGLGLMTTYPPQDANGNQSPVVMDLDAGNTYSHTLRGLSATYAGKWILFYTRITAGNGQLSSKWAANDALWQLPYVKLGQPEVTVSSQERIVSATNTTNPDVPAPETWPATQTVLQWGNAEPADACEIALTGKDSTGTPEIFRIEEDSTGGTGKVKVFHKTLDTDGATVIWSEVDAEPKEPVPDEGATERIVTFRLPGYQNNVAGSYVESEAENFYEAQLDTVLEVKWEKGQGFAYTLVLPDAENLRPKEGITITSTEQPDLRITSKAEIWSDVKVNSPEGAVPPSQSDAYVKSGPSVSAFTNQ